jgi:hypothetical protein
MSQCSELVERLEGQILKTKNELDELPPIPYVAPLERQRAIENKRRLLEQKLEILQQRYSRALQKGGC